MDFELWRFTDETQHVLKEIAKRIESKKAELLDFGGLIRSPELIREYCYALGSMMRQCSLTTLLA